MAKPRIAVVGAGLAGLTVGYRLLEAGYDVQVYEARSRVGGRVLSVLINGEVVELGGQNLLDGGKAENILNLCSELDLKTHSYSRALNPYYVTSNHPYNIEELLAELKLNHKAIGDKLSELATKHQTMCEIMDHIVDSKSVLYQYIAFVLTAYEGGVPENLSSQYISTLYYLLLGGISEAHQQTDDGETTIDSMEIVGGNSILALALAQKLHNRIHLNMPLREIRRGKGQGYILSFDNEEIESDIVILAVPISIYKDLQIDRSIIPKERMTMMQQIPMGAHAKYIIPLNESREIPGTYVIEGRAVTIPVHSTKLTLLYFARQPQYPSEGKLISADLYNCLEEIYGKGNVQPQENEQHAKDQILYKYNSSIHYLWASHPYSKGTYSYVSPHCDTGFTHLISYQGEKVRALFAPIHGNFFFAGEHTTSLLDFSGTMEAAVESGERIARLIKNIN